MGAGGASTDGVNWLPPVGLMVFSVGDTGGATVVVVAVVVVVVVVVLDGVWLPPPPQAAVNPPIAMMAAAPATAGRRRAKRLDLMMQSYLSRDGPFATCWTSAIRCALVMSTAALVSSPPRSELW